MESEDLDGVRAARRDRAFIAWACGMSASVAALLTSVAILLFQ